MATEDSANTPQQQNSAQILPNYPQLIKTAVDDLKDATETESTQADMKADGQTSLPLKRGRGRPPKNKEAVVTRDVARPRGRPPKLRDPVGKVKTPSGRGRGRPPKKAKTEAGQTEMGSGPTRGRGRPPKVKPPVAAVAG